MAFRYESGNSLLQILFSSILLMAAGIVAGSLAQHFLFKEGYDTFWSMGLLMIVASCAVFFHIASFCLSALASNLSGLPLSRTFPRHSMTFAPFLLLVVYFFLPAYNRQSYRIWALGVVLVLAAMVGARQMYQDRKPVHRKSPANPLDKKVLLSLVCCLIVAAGSFRLHDRYLIRLTSSEIKRASSNGVSMPIKWAKMPGTITWKGRVPREGFFEIDVIPNRKWQPQHRSTPISYELSIKVGAGKEPIVSKGTLDRARISRIRHDLSRYEGETAIFEMSMREPLSIGSLLHGVHTLLRPSLWTLTGRSDRRPELIQAYWSEPILRSPREQSEPNILLILMDTLRVDHVGCYGYELDTTPTIDDLALNGILFRQAVSQAPRTLPSVASIYTSRLPTSHAGGARRGKLATVKKLPQQANLIALLRERGYYTIGLANNPYLSETYDMDQGFDYYSAYNGNAKDGSDLMCQWLELNAEKKFFAFLHYIDPHGPYTLHEDFRSLSPKKPRFAPRKNQHVEGHERTETEVSYLAAYDSEIAFADAQIKVVLDKLDQMDLLESTIIIFVSDHGEEFGDHGSMGHGHSLYDELLRVPLVFHYPARLPKGIVIESQVRLTDILPTVFDLIGSDLDASALDGESLLPLIFTETFDDRQAVSEYVNTRLERKSIRTGRHKLIYTPSSGKVRLYDLSLDPLERIDIAENEPDLRDYLLRQLKAQLERSSNRAAVEAEAPPLSDEVRESLKALGYLN